MTFTYKSVDQITKDFNNRNLVREVLRGRPEHGCVIGLDDETNGTITSFVHGGYRGVLASVQRDQNILPKQKRHVRATFGGGSRFPCHFGDIYRHFGTLHDVWVDANDVDLWNFDFMGTFHGETAPMIRRFLENPPVCMRNDEPGTLVAFTFQAVVNGNLMVKLKNVAGWETTLAEQRKLKTGGPEKIAEHYHNAIEAILAQHKPSCVTFEPVSLDLAEGFHVHGHSVIYGGARRNDSTMMFTLYRARHDGGCIEEHTFSPTTLKVPSSLERGKRKRAAAEETSSETDSLAGSQDESIDQVEVDRDDGSHTGEYIVDEIIATKVIRGKTFYRVTWKGFDDITWEPEQHLADCAALDRWEEKTRTLALVCSPCPTATINVSHLPITPPCSDVDEDLAMGVAEESYAGSLGDDDGDYEDEIADTSDYDCEKGTYDDDGDDDDGDEQEADGSSAVEQADGAGNTTPSSLSLLSCEQSLPDGHQTDMVDRPTGTGGRTLYQFQSRCVDLAGAEMRGFFNIVCGAGKTVIMERILSDVSCGVLFVPAKMLVEQVSDGYFSSPTVELVKINSDHSPNNKPPIQLSSGSDKKKLIIIANLQSIHKVYSFCAKRKVKPEVICYDEAHRYTSQTWLRILGGGSYYEGEHLDEEEEEEYNNTDNDVTFKQLYQSFVAEAKNFFFTATPTPPMYRYNDIFGRELFRYTHKQGVDDRIVKNFDTVIEFCRTEDVPRSSDSVCYPDVIKSVIRLARERALKRILIYTRFVATANIAVATAEGLWEHRNLFPRRFQTHIISASTNIGERQDVFDSFRNEDDGRVHIIISCRTLSEGVDLVNCDCVVNLDPSKSIVQAVQRGTRPCRLTREERLTGKWRNATLFYPVNISTSEFFELMNADERRDDYVNSQLRLSQFEYAMRIINYLKNDFDMKVLWNWKPVDAGLDEVTALEDYEMEDCDVDTSNGKEPSVAETISIAEIRALTSEEDDLSGKWGVEGFDDRMNYLCVKLSGDPDEKWMANYREGKAYIEVNDYPRTKSSNVTAKRIARWFFSQRKKGANNLLKDWQTRLMNELPGWSWEGKTVMSCRKPSDVQQERPQKRLKTVAQVSLSPWELTYAQISYSGEPTQETRPDWYRWCHRQRTDYSQGLLTEGKVALLRKLTWWKWEVVGQNERGEGRSWKDFDTHIQEVRIFVDQHKRLPKDGGSPDERRLGQWLQSQRHRRKQGLLQERRAAELETLPGWFWSRDLDGPWWASFEKVKTYCEKYRKPPSAGSLNPVFRKLGEWTSAQRQTFLGNRPNARALTQRQIESLEALPGWFWKGVSYGQMKIMRNAQNTIQEELHRT